MEELRAFNLLEEADWSSIERVSYLKNEQVDYLAREFKGKCTHKEWHWLKLLKKATNHFWKTYNDGVDKGKLFLSEEIKSYSAFEVLGNSIPDKFIKQLELLKK